MIAVRPVTPSASATALSGGSAEELAELRDRFDRDNLAQLPGFLDPAVCDEMISGIEAADFEDRQHGEIGSEGCMRSNATLAKLVLIANDERLFEAVRQRSRP